MYAIVPRYSHFVSVTERVQHFEMRELTTPERTGEIRNSKLALFDNGIASGGRNRAANAHQSIVLNNVNWFAHGLKFLRFQPAVCSLSLPLFSWWVLMALDDSWLMDTRLTKMTGERMQLRQF